MCLHWLSLCRKDLCAIDNQLNINPFSKIDKYKLLPGRK